MENNIFLRIAQERYTTKHYNGGQAIPREQFDSLLEILRLAPTSVNCQAWHFVTASTREAREKLLPAFPDFNRERVSEASDVIVFCVPKKLDDAHFERVLAQEVADGRLPNAELQAQQDAGRRHFAGLHMGSEAELVAWEARQAYIGMGIVLYAAAGMGIDSTCLEGVDFEKLDEILGLAERGLTSVVALSLGYRNPRDGNATRPKSRLPKEELFTEFK
ncbi:nitroreductase family protein [Sutterella sp.]|uniref:nitroreductase family protein n=1 Tax=Sutterella sp. TaxID=1981025 RepID=UPI0026E0BD09|nr:nitroreductase family protein [Sutterella sp.]MDO5531347.1 nitroreductase family protein [Sutterella sp.]